MKITTAPGVATVDRLARVVVAEADRNAAVDRIVDQFVADLKSAAPGLRPGALRRLGAALRNRINARVLQLGRHQRVVAVDRDEGGRR